MALQVDEKWLRSYCARTGQKMPDITHGGAYFTPAPGSPVFFSPMPEKPRRNKYGNRRVEIDGMKFDSQHEAEFYFGTLVPRMRAGELKTVCRQVKFDLPGGIVYVADFVTIRPDMSIEGVYDAKSEPTKQNRVYINKKKQMKACWGIDIVEV